MLLWWWCVAVVVIRTFGHGHRAVWGSGLFEAEEKLLFLWQWRGGGGGGGVGATSSATTITQMGQPPSLGHADTAAFRQQLPWHACSCSVHSVCICMSRRGWSAHLRDGRSRTSATSSLYLVEPLAGSAVLCCSAMQRQPVTGSPGKPEATRATPKMRLISSFSMRMVSDIKLIRTDTTLDLSQKAEKV